VAEHIARAAIEAKRRPPVADAPAARLGGVRPQSMRAQSAASTGLEVHASRNRTVSGSL